MTHETPITTEEQVWEAVRAGWADAQAQIEAQQQTTTIASSETPAVADDPIAHGLNPNAANLERIAEAEERAAVAARKQNLAELAKQELVARGEVKDAAELEGMPADDLLVLAGITKSEQHEIKRKERRRKRGLPVEREPITYGELRDRVLAQYTKSTQSKETLTYNLEYSLRTFKAVRVRELEAEMIGSWLADLTRRDGEPLAQRTRAHALKAMRQVLNRGVAWGYLDRNPAGDVEMPDPDTESKHPFHSWEEVFAVADAIGDCYSPLVRFVCATGLRPQEWQALQWQDIDLASRRLHIRRTVQAGVIVEGKAKTKGSLRPVDIQRVGLDALDDLPTPLTQTQLVLPTPSGGLINRQSFRNGPWKRALEEAGLDDRTPHAMRDTFATLSYAAGMHIEAIAKQMGHVDKDGNPNPATTLRCYAKFLRSVDERNLALLDQYATNSSAAGRKTDGRAEESQQP